MQGDVLADGVSGEIFFQSIIQAQLSLIPEHQDGSNAELLGGRSNEHGRSIVKGSPRSLVPFTHWYTVSPLQVREIIPSDWFCSRTSSSLVFDSSVNTSALGLVAPVVSLESVSWEHQQNSRHTAAGTGLTGLQELFPQRNLLRFVGAAAFPLGHRLGGHLHHLTQLLLRDPLCHAVFF